MKYLKGLLGKLNDLNFVVAEMPTDGATIHEICVAGGRVYSPLDTHYIMQFEHIVFIGNKAAISGFVNDQHAKHDA